MKKIGTIITALLVITIAWLYLGGVSIKTLIYIVLSFFGVLILLVLIGKILFKPGSPIKK